MSQTHGFGLICEIIGSMGLTIRFARTEWAGSRPSSAVTERSNDTGQNWIELDQGSRNCDLNGFGLGVVQTFCIASGSKVISTGIWQTGVESSESNYQVLKSVTFVNIFLLSHQ
jgi:hypothetical protein